MSTTAPNLKSANDGDSLSRVLGLPSLVFFGIAYMVPLTVFTTYGVVSQVSHGHVATSYIFTLIAMLFTAYSYGRMVRAFPIAGSSYSYSRKAFGGHIGFMVGWALMLDYIFMPMIDYLAIGIFLKGFIPGIPQEIWITVTAVLVTILNILGIKLVSKANFLIIAFQLIFLAVFISIAITMFISTGNPPLFSPFYSEDMAWAGVFSGAAILALSFVGFDAVSTLAEETPKPRRDVPRAIMICALAAGILFIIVAWASHMIFPNYHNFESAAAAADDIMYRAAGTFMVAFFTAAYVVGVFASAMAAQASVSRILFAMGRDRALPEVVFGQVSKRYATPVSAILFVSAVSLLGALTLSLSLVATMISFGALVAFSFVNLSVFKHYVIDQKKRQSTELFKYGMIPIIGFFLTIWLWTSLEFTAFEVGLSWVGVGIVYLVYLTRFFQRPVPELELSE